MTQALQSPSAIYYKDQISLLGRHLIFVDTGAIIGYFDKGDDRFYDLVEELVEFTFITSTYVVAETVRRLVKAKEPSRFLGPKGETTGVLCRHLLREWLAEKNVRVICVPEHVFDEAKQNFYTLFAMGCDLGDVLSFTIIRGLDQNLILSPDRDHFGQMGLDVLC